MRATTLYFLLASSVTALRRTAWPYCAREALHASTQTYIAAQSAGRVADVLAMAAPNISYTENAVARDIRTGVLTQALRIDHNRSSLDTTQCATYTELIVADPRTPRVIGTQLRFAQGGATLLGVETLVTQPGDWLFNASGTLRYARAEEALWAPIDPAVRDSRAVIQAAADAYLDVFSNKSVVVPWGTPCTRLEGSVYTGRGLANDSCNVGIPSGVAITNRRYIIDETVGAVDALVKFASVPDSHEFRVEKGKLRLIHTLTVMRNVTGA